MKIIDLITNEYALIIAVLTVIEILLRRIPTFANLSITDLFHRIFSSLIPNVTKDKRRFKIKKH